MSHKELLKNLIEKNRKQMPLFFNKIEVVDTLRLVTTGEIKNEKAIHLIKYNTKTAHIKYLNKSISSLNIGLV